MTVEKVTAFITRERPHGRQLLLFQHPQAGVQIPAGTVEIGEHWRTAVLREASEETGLTELTVRRYLGQIENELAPGEAVLNQDSYILSKPDAGSLPFAPLFSRGVTLAVTQLKNGRFRQVTYAEFDQLPNPNMITLQIIGWLPEARLSWYKPRHLVHLLCRQETPDRWSQPGDRNHIFSLFWVDLQPKPAVVPPQSRWLDAVYEKLFTEVV